MKKHESILQNYFLRYSRDRNHALALTFASRIEHLPILLRIFSKGIGLVLCRSKSLDNLLDNIPIIQSFARLLAGNAELVLKSAEPTAHAVTVNTSIQDEASVYDLVVIGSGPGGSVAALRAAESGLKVLILESGSAYKTGSIEHHSLTQTELQFKNGGLNFIWGAKPVLFAEGGTLGGGSEVNSGLYHRLVGTHRAKILNSVGATEEEWVRLEELVEKELSVQNAPTSIEPEVGLIAGAKRMGLIYEEIPRWRIYEPTEQHQGMQETYLTKAQQIGVQILTCTPVRKLIAKTDYVEIQISGAHSNRQIKTLEVVIAAGTIETPMLLNRSRISKRKFELNFHPMIRFVSAQSSDINDGDLFPSWQAWTADYEAKYGYSVSTYPYLAATLSSLGQRGRLDVNDYKTMAAYFASFALHDSRVHLRRFGKKLIPTIRWGTRDREKIKSVSNQLAVLLKEGGAVEIWPKKGISPITTVHLFGSIPLGRSPLVDDCGRIKSEPRIRISDGSLMPHAPWGNPQGPIMVLCELMSERCLNE
jgi:choline dehydrogenase-like flavoprotein